MLFSAKRAKVQIDIVAALSRVVTGAHYASDVPFGAGFPIGWFLILNTMVAPAHETISGIALESIPATD